MARKIKRKRATKKTFLQKLASLLPETVQAFLARRIVDITAGVFFVAGVFVLLALMTYSKMDPSLNTAAASGRVFNWMGSPGAATADLFYQTLGGGALVLGLIPLVWGVRMMKRFAVAPIVLRALAGGFAALCFSVLFHYVPSFNVLPQAHAGGGFGQIVGGNLEFLNIPYKHGVIALVLFMVGFPALVFGCALSRYDVMNAVITVWNGAAAVLQFVYSAGSRFSDWVAHYNDPSYEAAPVLKKFKPLKLFGIRDADVVDPMETYVEPPKTVKAAKKNAGEDKRSFAQKRATFGGDQKSAIPVVKPKTSDAAKNQMSGQQRFALSETGEWEFPSLDLIETPPPVSQQGQLDERALQRNAELLQNVLADYGVKGEIVSIHPGPVVTLYELEPAAGTKSSKVISLNEDIARSMAAISVRCSVVPGRNVIGIEIPNKNRQIVYMQESLAADAFEKNKHGLPLILGKDISGQPIMADLSKMPHLLVAGTTGSGKSVAVNTMILSLLYSLSPEKCRFIMIDPKMLELSVYDDIPHLLTPVVTEPGKAVVALKWAVNEMEERYRAMSKLGVRNMEGFNARMREAIKNGESIMTKVQTGFDPETGKGVFEEQPMEMAELPYIVIIVDEFADLMLVAGKDVENAIQRLAQMARAAGIHLIMATQRPSVDVITGVIKANFPTRISFQVTSKIDSRTILGEGGAEQLLGKGDMLYMAPGGKVVRVHGPFVSDDDVEKVVDFLKSQAEPSYLSDVTDGGDFGDSEVMNAMFGEGEGSGAGNSVDELYDKAVAVIAREGKVSTSFVQRHLQIGYNRAARIVEEMERQGVISPANSQGKRQVLVQDHSGAA